MKVKKIERRCSSKERGKMTKIGIGMSTMRRNLWAGDRNERDEKEGGEERIKEGVLRDNG